MNLRALRYVLLPWIALPVFANDVGTARLEASLKRQAAAWDVAIISKDRPAIAANMAESFMQIDSDGSTADKRQFIDDVVAEDLTISPYTVENLRIRIYGTTALLTGTTIMHGTFKGKPFTSHYRFTDTYVKQHGRWQVVNVQTTRIK